jgi:hypothetical protein
VNDRMPGFQSVASVPEIALLSGFQAEIAQGQVNIIACIDVPAVIERILAHLNGKAPSTEPALVPENRAPPQARLFD